MGQATQAAASAIDLPDPTEPGLGPSSGTSGVGTDDLLAQLAGDEIDRLLAEAEVERPSARSPAPTPKTTAPSTRADDALLPSDPFAPTAPAEGRTGDAFVPTAPSEGTIIAGTSLKITEEGDGGTLLAAAEATEDPALSQELDALFANLDAKAAPAPASSPPPAPASVLDQLTPGHFPQARTAAEAPAAPAPADLEESDTSAAERAALDAELEESAAEVVQAAAAKADAAAPQPTTGGVPFYIRVLEWMNAPLAACSDSTRELVGKIAVLTLVNAIAVLVYVLFVR